MIEKFCHKKDKIMPTDTKLLESLDLFAQLNAEERQQIESITHTMKVVASEVLAKRDTPAREFFINVSGNFMIAFDQGRAITLHQKGDLMGWSSVFTPFRYKGTIVALTDGEVLSIPGEDFLRLILGNSSLNDKLMKTINQVAAERMSFVQASEAQDDI